MATALALRGGAPPAAQAALVAETVEDLNLADLDMQAARQMFLGFGTCSIAEPVDALVALGLLDD